MYVAPILFLKLLFATDVVVESWCCCWVVAGWDTQGQLVYRFMFRYVLCVVSGMSIDVLTYIAWFSYWCGDYLILWGSIRRWSWLFLDVIFIAVMVYLFCVLYVMIACKCEDFGRSLQVIWVVFFFSVCCCWHLQCVDCSVAVVEALDVCVAWLRFCLFGWHSIWVPFDM